MSIQLRLPFEDVPVTCPTQAKYHAIAPCLAEQIEPRQQARVVESFLFNRFQVAQAISGRRDERIASFIQ